MRGEILIVAVIVASLALLCGWAWLSDTGQTAALAARGLASWA